MLKNNKGITLIALVITIIVLLILAGVSIAMLTGDNGVLSRASSAKVANKLGEVKDEISLIAAETMTEYYQTTYVNDIDDSNVEYNPATLDTNILIAINKKISAGATTTNTGITQDDYEDITVVTTAYVPKNGETPATLATVTLKYQGFKVEGEINNGKVTWEPIEEYN